MLDRFSFLDVRTHVVSPWRFSQKPGVLTLLLLSVLICIASARAQETSPFPPSSSWGFERVTTYPSALAQVVLVMEQAADSGDGAAALALARHFLQHDDIHVQQRGVGYAERAAELGASDAHQMVASIYAEGRHGLVPNVVLATTALERSASATRSDELYALGSRLINNNTSALDTERGIELLTQAAQAGSVSASVFLGELYLDGRKTAGSPAAALYYFALGTLARNRAAIEGLGDVLRESPTEFSADPLLALAMFQEAAELGSRGAARTVAEMYLTDELGAPDLTKGEAMFLELGAAGDTNAFIELGDLYSSGELVTTDPQKAIEYYRTAANMGNASGFLRLARLAESNPGLAELSVVDSLEKAAELNDNGARRRLATIYLEGKQVLPDPQRALELLGDAAATGDAIAAEQLALIHADNTPLPADFEAVERYLALANNLGRRQAVIPIASAVAQGPLGRTHSNDALEWLTQAVEKSEPGAAAQLAALQLEGRFPGASVAGVISMLNDAAHSGDREAAKYLLRLYREGYGLLLPPDLGAAAAFLGQIGEVLGEEEALVEDITLLATGFPSSQTLELISEKIEKLSPAKAGSLLRRLRSQNDRVYVFIVQKHLSRMGFYHAAVHGTLDAPTIRSIQLACNDAGAARACAMGPLSFEAAQVLSGLFWPET